jgi:hypothetical protein
MNSLQQTHEVRLRGLAAHRRAPESAKADFV